VVKKIYRRTTGILQDLGIDSAEGEDSGVLADHDGIDTLCAALLTGTRVWMLDKAATHFTGESWFNSLLEFIQLLRQYEISHYRSATSHIIPFFSPRSEDLLPKAWIISQDLRTIIPTPYRLQEVDVLVEQGLEIGDIQQPLRARMRGPNAGNKRKALLIGIGSELPGGYAALRGAHKDVKAMTQLLIDQCVYGLAIDCLLSSLDRRYQYQPDDITVLIDEEGIAENLQPTRANIVRIYLKSR
jgi:hypothetical protein